MIVILRKLFCFILPLIPAVMMMLSVSCSKDDDDIKPEVEIFSPVENEAFEVGDSIYVSGRASDETGLTSVIVTLTDQNYIVKDYYVNIPVTGNPQEFGFWYTPANLQLPTGDYFIQVRASDKKNTKYKYRQIRLTKGPGVLKTLLVVTRNGDASFSLGTLDTATLDLIPQGTWNHTYSASDISEPSGQLYLLGRGIGECYAVNLETYSTNFNLQQSGTPSIYYHEGLFASSDNFFLGLTDGYVKGYNKTGSQNFSTTLATGRKPGVMAIHYNDHLIVAEKEKAGQGSWIAASFLNSGQRWKDYKLPDRFEVVAIKSLSKDEVMLAGNIDGSARVIVWNISANSLSTALQINSVNIRDMIELTPDMFLLATDNEILVYQPGDLTASSYLQHAGAFRLRLDGLSGKLFAGNTGSITVYDTKTGSLVWQKSLNADLADFYLQYQSNN